MQQKNAGKFNFSDSLFTYVIHFSGQPCFLSTLQLSFDKEQLSTFHVFIINNNHLSFLFRPLVSSVKDKNFLSTSFFYQVLLKDPIQVLRCLKVPFYEKLFWREFYSNFTNSAKDVFTFLKWQQKWAGYSFSILPLSCRCCRFE